MFGKLKSSIMLNNPLVNGYHKQMFSFFFSVLIILFFFVCSKIFVEYKKTFCQFPIQMSNLEEKLNILKKKKLTAKIIVEQQRNEIRLLKSSLTLNQRLEEIYKRFDKKRNLDYDLYQQIIQVSTNQNKTISTNDQLHRMIEDLSKLIKQILIILSLNPNHHHFDHQDLNRILKEQKECLKLIKFKLSDLYAHRVADEVSCITS